MTDAKASPLRDPDIPFLFEGPEYHTPADEAAQRRRPFPSVRLYIELLRLVLRCRSLALSGRYDRKRWAESAFDFVRIAEGLGGCFHIEGYDVVRNLTRPVVFAGNHMSTLETFCLPALLLPVTPLTFVVKQSLVNVPLFGPIMRATDPIVVTRRNPRADLRTVLEQGVRKIQSGFSCCIFPQTTRSREFRTGAFNTLPEKLAKRAGTVVIPVAVKTDFWETGRILRDFGRVHPERDILFAFGPPIDPARLGRATHRAILGFLIERLSAWGVPCFEDGPGEEARSRGR